MPFPRPSRLLAAPLALACTLSGTLPLRAAEVTLVDAAVLDAPALLSGTCSLRLSGPIEYGDTGRLEIILEAEDFPHARPTGLDFGLAAEGQSLCLDSPGGHDGEALAIANLVADRGLVTVVPKGATCVGACAIIFMSGSALSSNSGGGARMPMRVLDIGGRLGFHAPATPAAEGLGFGAGLDYITMLANLYEGVDSYLPTARFHPQLLVETLSRRDGDSPYWIETTGQAGLYGISLAGVPPVSTDETSWMRACNNLSLQATGWQAPTDPDLSSWAWMVNRPAPGHQPEARQPPEDLNLPLTPGDETGTGGFFREVLSRHHQCMIYHDAAASPPYGAWYERVAEDSMPRLRFFDLWQTLPHYTRLADLREMDQVSPTDFASLYGDPSFIAPGAGLPDITGFQPGQTLTLELDEEEHIPMSIWLGPEGAAKIYAPVAETVTATYRLEGATLCLLPKDSYESCGTITLNEDGSTSLVFYTNKHRIFFLRPGDIGPLPPFP